MAQTDKLVDRSQAPFIMLDHRILETPLTVEAFRIYAELKKYANKDGECFPSYARLGKAFVGSFPDGHEQTLRKKAINAVQELIDWGMLRKEERSYGDTQSKASNLYVLTPPSDWKKSPKQPSTLAHKSRPNQHKKKKGGVESTLPGVESELDKGGVESTLPGVESTLPGVESELIELDPGNYNQLTKSTHKSEEKFRVRGFEDVVNSFPEEEIASDSKSEQVEYRSSNVVNQEEVTQPTQDPKVDQVSAKFVDSEQTNYIAIDNVESLPKAINGMRQVPWEKQGASRNNRYDQPFATWLYENHLKKYTGFTSKGYEENLLTIRGYLGKVHTDSTRMERVVDFWNDYVKLVSVPQEKSLDTPLQSFLTGCGDRLRGIVLSHDFTPEQLESIAELWVVCRKKEELTILCLEDEGLLKL